MIHKFVCLFIPLRPGVRTAFAKPMGYNQKRLLTFTDS